MTLKKLAQVAVSATALLSLAVPAFSETKAADNAELTALLKRGYGQICVGMYNPAIETLSKAVRINQDDVPARRYLIYAQLQVGQVTEALDQLKLLLKGRKPDAMDSYLLGEAHLEIGWIDSAEDDFKNALKLRPNMKSAQIGLIKVKVCNSDFDGALKLCSEALNETKGSTNPAALRLNEYFKKLAAAVRTAQVNAQGDSMPGGLPGFSLPGAPGGPAEVPPATPEHNGA